MEATDKELQLLEHIRDNSGVHQRDLARTVGVSLGMTNAILKRLAKKGLLTVRKVNNRNIRYAVSPAGVEEIARRSYRYLRRTVGNVVRYREAVEALVADIKQRGFGRVAMLGDSDLEFMVEHFCRESGIQFSGASVRVHGLPEDRATFYVLSESAGMDDPAGLVDSEHEAPCPNMCELRRLLTDL